MSGRNCLGRPGREMQHDRRVLADRIEHHRPFALGDDLAHDVDALGLEPFEVREPGGLGFFHLRGHLCGIGRPHKRAGPQ